MSDDFPDLRQPSPLRTVDTIATNGSNSPEGWPLVRVRWMDSHYLGVGWQGPIDFEDRATICESVGWLALDGEQVKVLMPHRSVQDGTLNQGGGIIQIPACCIARITHLRENLGRPTTGEAE